MERYRVLRIYRLFLFFKKERKVKKKSGLIIPVSCTEQGRWSYQTDEFFNSENILSYKIRGKKTAFVSDSLKQSGEYDSDQGAIWDDIQELSLCLTMSYKIFEYIAKGIFFF